MATVKVAITIDEDLLGKLDNLIKSRIFPNRSRAIQGAVRDKLEKLEHGRLARECAKLDKSFEMALAEESPAGDEWPEY
jgi:metal-responsive CopG/Arc/MetJ family transcriptional regulator